MSSFASLPQPSISTAFRVATSSAELRQGVSPGGEPFGDFSAFSAGGENQVGLGRARSSIDPGHAARLVTDHLLEG